MKIRINGRCELFYDGETTTINPNNWNTYEAHSSSSDSGTGSALVITSTLFCKFLGIYGTSIIVSAKVLAEIPLYATDYIE